MRTAGHRPGPTSIAADYSSLTRLAAQLRGLADALADPGAGLPLGQVEDEVALAMARAEHDWHAQRRRLGAYLTEAAEGADAAAQAYRQVDADIARASSAPPASARGTGGGHGPRAN